MQIQRWSTLAWVAAIASVVWMAGLAAAPQSVNPRAAAMVEFNKRVTDYLDFAKKQASGMPPLKQTPNPEELAGAEKALGDKIRAARATAKQGDVFTPEITEILKVTIKQHYSQQTIHKKKELLDETPIFRPAVNQIYPPNLPKGTMTAGLLRNLPKLPTDVEYRLVGTNLILRDVKANIIVDFIPDALPPSAKQQEDKS